MTWHLLKMVWNRKRMNLLIIEEIFASFLVLFCLTALSLYAFDNYKIPLGFSFKDVWLVRIDPKTYNYGVSVLPDPDLQEKYRQVLIGIRSFEPVESMAAAGWVPYSAAEWGRTYQQGNTSFYYSVNEASDEFKDVMNLQVVRGRWFEPADDALNWQPVVVNEEFARMAFGNEDPVGKIVPRGMIKLRSDATTDDPYIFIDGRVVGVIAGFRNNGEFSATKPYAFYRRSLKKPSSDMLPCVVIKVKSGTPRSFEEQLMKTLNSIGGDWSFSIRLFEDMRESARKTTVIPIQIAFLVAGFLMLMVAFGIMGVLWQSVTQRVTEIGLRRAQGATAADIYRQILWELFFIATLALIPGILLIVQFPLLNLIGDLKPSVYFYSITLSVFLIYMLTFICGLYPGWMATRIRPAEALHYE